MRAVLLYLATALATGAQVYWFAGWFNLGCSDKRPTICIAVRFARLVYRSVVCDVEAASGGNDCALCGCCDLVFLCSCLGRYPHSAALHYVDIKTAPSFASSPVVPACADTGCASHTQHILRSRYPKAEDLRPSCCRIVVEIRRYHKRAPSIRLFRCQ